MSFNKKINTTKLEQLKTGVIIALVVGISAFIAGMRYTSNQAITVDNNITVQAQELETVEAVDNTSKK